MDTYVVSILERESREVTASLSDTVSKSLQEMGKHKWYQLPYQTPVSC